MVLMAGGGRATSLRVCHDIESFSCYYPWISGRSFGQAEKRDVVRRREALSVANAARTSTRHTRERVRV